MRWISLLLLLSALATQTACKRPSIGYNNGYEPNQPIPYSHKLHAGQLQIPCQYCHSSVSYNAHSNVPSVNVCMNCHKVVKTGSPLIKEITKKYENNEPIQWIKVTMLPDYVRFNHSVHVNRNINCTTCHGPIETMEVVYQYSDLSMGWCLSCHRAGVNEKGEKLANGPPYKMWNYTESDVKKLHSGYGMSKPSDGKRAAASIKIKEVNDYGLIKHDKVWQGPQNCSACHY